MTRPKKCQASRRLHCDLRRNQVPWSRSTLCGQCRKDRHQGVRDPPALTASSRKVICATYWFAPMTRGDGSSMAILVEFLHGICVKISLDDSDTLGRPINAAVLSILQPTGANIELAAMHTKYPSSPKIKRLSSVLWTQNTTKFSIQASVSVRMKANEFIGVDVCKIWRSRKVKWWEVMLSHSLVPHRIYFVGENCPETIIKPF